MRQREVLPPETPHRTGRQQTRTEADWDQAWGGEALVLDDGGCFPPRTAPEFGEFDRIIPARVMGNRSLFFARRDNGWHGVREIRCPKDCMCKVFIVVINPSSLYWRVRDAVKGKSITRY